MAQEKKKEFSAEGATVTVPGQNDNKKVKIEKLPKDSLDKMKPKPGGFKPGRVVFNFQIVDEDDPEKVLTTFDPPFELRVRYTQGDLKRAQKAGKPLELAFWNGSEWIKFTEAKHQFKLEADSKGSGGYGVAKISNWGDPKCWLGTVKPVTDDVVLLAQVPLFAKLPQDELQYLADNLDTCQYSPGEIIFCEGDQGDRFYVVRDGQLEILKSLNTEDERVLAQRYSGEFIGEMSLFRKDGLRMASVRAARQTKLWIMSRHEFNDLLRRQPLLAYEMVSVLSTKLNNAHSAAIEDLREKNRQLQQAYDQLKAAQEQIVEKEKLEHELTLARDIQMSILPQTLPGLPGFDFGARIETARHVGGDFFDFIPLDGDKLGITIGDVTDKGVPAALFMAQTHALLRAEAGRGGSPRQTLLNVNQCLMEMNATGLFVTVLYGILDPQKKVFSYARAGHELPITCNPQRDAELMPLQTGQPLGILDEPLLDEQTVQLSTGDLLLLYTDGLTDECNPQGVSFGMERLLPVACEFTGMGAQDTCDHILRRVTEFLDGAPQYDDLTLLVIGGT